MTGIASVDVPQFSRGFPAIYQGISDREMSFHPQLSEEGSFAHELTDAGDITGYHIFRKTIFVAPEYADILGRESIQEKWRMGCREDLSARGRRATFLDEPREQARVKKVLRLFDADEGSGPAAVLCRIDRKRGIGSFVKKGSRAYRRENRQSAYP